MIEAVYIKNREGYIRVVVCVCMYACVLVVCICVCIFLNNPLECCLLYSTSLYSVEGKNLSLAISVSLSLSLSHCHLSPLLSPLLSLSQSPSPILFQQLRHENLVNLIEVFRRKKRLYLVFEFVDHTVLDDLEKCPNGLDENTVRRVLWQVLRGIEFCHLHNVSTRISLQV